MDEFIDFTSGEIDSTLSDDLLLSHDGDLLGRVDDHWALDYRTGELHFTEPAALDNSDDWDSDDGDF